MKSKKSAESFAGSIEKFNRAGRDFEQKMSESAQVGDFRVCFLPAKGINADRICETFLKRGLAH